MKTIKLIFVFLLCTCLMVHATNYYVRTDGNDNNAGTSNSSSGAWKTIASKVSNLNAGDILWIADGTYYESNEIKFENKTASSSNPITIKAINKRMAKIESTSPWPAITVSACVGIVIQDLDIYFPSGSTNIYMGVSVMESDWITIKGNAVHNCGLTGIQPNTSDNVLVEGNYCYGNSNRNGSNGSGISIYHPKVKSASPSGFGIIVRNNISYNNNCTIGDANGNVTDGNGIIIDDFLNDQGGGEPGGYRKACLVENNLCYNNGGRGIHVFSSGNTTVRNNTCWHNCYTLNSRNVYSGDLSVDGGTNNKLINNIAVTNPAYTTYGCAMKVNSDGNSTILINNMMAAPTDNQFQTYQSSTTLTGNGNSGNVGNTSDTYPLFISPSTNSSADFHLQSSSPARNTGYNSNAPSNDLDYNTRPAESTVDKGCYEYAGSSSGSGVPPIVGIRIEAENNFSVVTEVGSNGAIAANTYAGTIQCSNGQYLSIYDINDEAKITATASQAGTYTILVRVRSGYTGASTDYIVNNKYEIRVDDVVKTFTLVAGSVSSIDVDCYYGTLQCTGIALSAGNHYIRVKALDTWQKVDYVETIKTASSDTQAPTAPTNVNASAITQTGCNLSWTASTDNVGVLKYHIYKNGTWIAETNPSTLSYNVAGLSANTSYTFGVQAQDAAVNYSNSTSISVKTLSVNLLANPGAENGTTSWSGQSCTLTAITSQKNTGSNAFQAAARSGAYGGPRQDVLSAVTSKGQGTYYAEAWVKMASGTANAKVTIYLKYNNTDYYVSMTSVAVNATGWTKVSATFNLTWSGTLQAAGWYAETDAGTTTMYVDDCWFNKGTTKSALVVTNVAANKNGFFTMYPNPVSNQNLTLTFSENGMGKANYISIFDLAGKKVFVKSTTDSELLIDASLLKQGIYIVIVAGNNKLCNQKLVVK